MTRVYLPFIDWMKAAGITLIVVGHVAGRPFNGLTPPIYPKQLGVAFFVFVMAYSLANEHRPWHQVLFKRLFELYLFALGLALLLSGVGYATRGGLQLSNYMPLFFGSNVVVNNFPANPTTWYVGTYLHILVTWAVLVRRLRVRSWMIAVSLVVEVLIRVTLINATGGFVAYMALPNWMTVFLMGQFVAQRDALAPAATASDPRARVLPGLAGIAASVVLLGFLVSPHVVDRSFPFMRLEFQSTSAVWLLTSAGVSLVYVVFTALAYIVAAGLNQLGFVRFIARNTIIVFLAHMPLYYAVDAALPRWISNPVWQALVRVVVCLPLLALLSEFIRRAVNPMALRSQVGRLVFGGEHAAAR